MKTEDVLSVVKKEKIKFVQLQFMDILGFAKSVTIPTTKLEDAMDRGIIFDGSSIVGYATIDESDMRLQPVLDTFLVLPWSENEHKTARMICNIYSSDGKRFKGDPRYVLERLLDRINKKGYVFNTGPEFEFFLFKLGDNGEITSKPNDHGAYFDLMPHDEGDHIRKEAVIYANSMGFDVEMIHHEVAAGQQEIDIKYSDAMNSADRIMLLKYLIKTVALKYNYHASFMPKPVFGEAGNGMHVHQSLISTKGENIFYDPKGEHELSDKAVYFLGGLLEHSRETCGILASWVNSYKRLVPGYEAPVYISWANRNRSALIRIPAGREMSTRLEVRNPDPAGNPYLQFAVMLASGLDGMDRKIAPPEPVEKDIYKLSRAERHKLGIGTLPESLGEALHFLKESEIVKETLGDHIFEHFLHIKRLEWDDYKAQVTTWERDRFLAHL